MVFLLLYRSVEITGIISTAFLEKFREINGFSKSSTKEFIWRNISLLREKLSFFYTVRCAFLIKTKNSVKTTSLLNRFTMKLFARKISKVTQKFCFILEWVNNFTKNIHERKISRKRIIMKYFRMHWTKSISRKIKT